MPIAKITHTVAAAIMMALVLSLASPAAAAAPPTWNCGAKNLATGEVYQSTDGSALTDAIAEAAAGSRIQVRGTCVGNYTIDKQLRLIGTSTARLPTPTLDGNAEDTTLMILNTSAHVQKLTIRNGLALACGCGGGGIYALDSNVVLRNVHVIENDSESFGGGVYNDAGTLTMTGGSVGLNYAPVAGGGIENDTGTVTLNDVLVYENTADSFGGGIDNYFGAVTLNGDTSVSSNDVTGGEGGGIYAFNDSTTTMNGTSVVTGNDASTDGGGIWAACEALLVNVVSGGNVHTNTPNDVVQDSC